MKTNYEIRYAAHPEDAKSYDTTRIRRDFLIEKIFVPNEVTEGAEQTGESIQGHCPLSYPLSFCLLSFIYQIGRASCRERV